jgi:hypothetical protein
MHLTGTTNPPFLTHYLTTNQTGAGLEDMPPISIGAPSHRMQGPRAPWCTPVRIKGVWGWGVWARQRGGGGNDSTQPCPTFLSSPHQSTSLSHHITYRQLLGVVSEWVTVACWSLFQFRKGIVTVSYLCRLSISHSPTPLHSGLGMAPPSPGTPAATARVRANGYLNLLLSKASLTTYI